MSGKTFFFVALITGLLLGACGQNSSRDLQQPLVDSKIVAIISGQGTVRYTSVEGGAYLIDSTQGTLIPVGLDSSLAQDGLKIEFKAHKIEGSVSYIQSGTLVQIVSAQAL